MISAEDVKLVQKRFSKAAERYDRLAFIQNDIRRELVEKLASFHGGDILDVGSGTGALLEEIVGKNPSGMNVGLDLAWGMVDTAREAGRQGTFIQGDGCALPFKSGSFDLVVSASSYQWAVDIDRSFDEARRVLKEGGRFRAALFGQGTLGEFFESLHVAGPNIREKLTRIDRFPSHGDVRRALESAGFADAAVFSENRQAVFRDLWSFLVWLKSVGANSLAQGVFFGRRALANVQDHYSRHFGVDGGIRVTFEVIWIDAEK
ncbi:MAG: methyltransferase domain-containing protein [Candidatus Omnitrophica bacterium]|nr:methyltransferase domain-containing protein [Candidatus Omnitrophota bacterium]